jgi:signal transduction histidine kinase
MTIRLRLTIYWAAVLLLLLVGAAVAVLLLFQRQQWGQLDGPLMEEADTAAETIAHGAAAPQMIARLSEERDLGPKRRVWVVVGGRTIAAAGDHRADLPILKELGNTRMLVDGRGDIFRYAIVPFLLNGAPAYLADGVDAHAVRESVRRLRASLLLVLPVLLVSSVWVGYWLAARALAPLVTVTRALAEIKPRDLSRRLPLAPIDDELDRLSSAINALLERVERASAAERRFVIDAAHELRTPLAVLRAGIEVVLRRKRTAAEYVRALHTALCDAAALCTLADDLLAFTRLDHELSLGRELIDLRRMTEEVIGAIEPLTASKRLRIDTNLCIAASVQGNRDHLRRVMINLLDNALKFTPEEGRIRITLESHDGRVKLCIADSGPGIDEKDLPFIFERFFRSCSAGNESGKGLGLSLCHEIVELHGGTISAANRSGGGTEFVVVLPASPVAIMG